MIVSIVTGTYNRIGHLQEMVQSVRNSIPIGLDYEIVIVDGGSTDGTLDWCKQQGDILLIEHGKLLGAVRAFNDGAKAAHGEYVILANDDITFIYESIMNAIRFMQDHQDTGIGCFYQDRRGDSWHVEQMPAIKSGRQISMYYGQVCIIPKQLGDYVGWWGNYLRTYGGDNEMSCKVLELGYKITPIECACIHDTTPQDELRKVNNDNVVRNGKHPDTEKFVARWTHSNGLKGPVIGSKVGEFRFDVPAYFRVLYAPIYERGHKLQHQTKRGLRDALKKIGLVVECDYVEAGIDYLYDLNTQWQPHLILTQFHNVGDGICEAYINDLRRSNPLAKFVNWNGDYHPEHLFSEQYIRMMQRYDLAGFVTANVQESYDKRGVNWFYWQIGYETYDPVPEYERNADIVMLANGYSDARKRLLYELRDRGIRVDLYGIGWPDDLHSLGDTLYDFRSGAKIYKSSKISISDSQWPDAGGFVSNRLFQALEAGTLLMQQRFADMEQLLGLRDGEHLVVWDTVDDLAEKIRYYLKHSTERQRIMDAGKAFIVKFHSFDVRVAELLSKLGWLGYA